MGFVQIEASDIDSIVNAIEEFQGNAEREITDILHGEGYEEINRKIRLLIPASGQNWKGKATAASHTDPLRDTKPGTNLYVEVGSKPRYNYLYFPDDGSNTVHHAGQQHFMLRGAENAKDKIVDLCLKKLTENFNK